MISKHPVCSRTPSLTRRARAASLLIFLSLTLPSCTSRAEGGGPPESLGFEPGNSDPSPISRAQERLDLQQIDRLAFIQEVLARNPSIEVARQGWRAALAELPQVTALPDPRLEYSTAPLSIGSSRVPYRQIVRASQRFPWPGKLALEEKIATAEAEAAHQGYEATRQNMALVASMLFDQYRAVTRSLELNGEHRRLTLDMKAAAGAQYEAGSASVQEPLQAELEHSRVLHQRVILESRQAVVTAQMNGLLHRSPERFLPAPAAWVAPTHRDLEETGALQEQALRNNPERLATHARVRARESAVRLARQQYYPDVSLKGAYNSLWTDRANRWTVGLSVDIPIQLGARNGAVAQARARLAGAQAQLEADDDAIRVGVERARQQLIEARNLLNLYQDRLLPTVRAQIEAAQIGYETGRNGFQALIDTERSLRALEIEHQDAIAMYGRRSAELDRALGRSPGRPRAGETR